MSSTQQVIVKAYYNDLVETQPEIRRFPVSSLNYHELNSKCVIFRLTFHQPMIFIKHWKQLLLD